MNELSDHAAIEAAIVVDDRANYAAAKGKHKVREPFGPTTSASPKASLTIGMDDAEAEAEVEVEDPTIDLVSLERHSGNREASFSPS